MMKTLIRLAWEALFLSEGPYAEMHDDFSQTKQEIGVHPR